MGKSLRYIVLACIFATFILSVAGEQQQPASQTQTPAEQSSSQAAVSSATPAPSSTPDKVEVVPDFESSTVLKVTTRLVVLDVVATDGRGNHVTDLKATDFTVLENGKEQKIKNFSFQHPALPESSTQARPHLPKLPSNVFTNITEFQHPSALNVLLLDTLNTTLPNQAYARSEALKYLGKMPENQPIAIFTLSTRLRMLQDFSSDPNVLKQAIKNYKGSASTLLDNPAGGEEVGLLASSGVSDTLDPGVQQSLQQFESERTSGQLDLRVRMTTQALQAIAKALAGYPGRKNLVWVSETFPVNVYPDSDLGLGAFGPARNYNEDILKTANALLDAQVAVYPVSAAGLETLSVTSAESTGTGLFRPNANSGAAFGKSVEKTYQRTAAAHLTMEELADRTGGKAFYDRNDIDNVVKSSIDDGSTYYLLGYSPADKNWDGKFRKTEVKVNRPGVKLRYRAGYYAAEPKTFANEDKETRAKELTNALSLETPIATMLTFMASVVPPSEQTKNKVVVNYNVDARALTFEREADGLEHADVECVAQVYSEKGKPVAINGHTMQAALKPDTFKWVVRSGFPCNHDLDLPPGNYLMRLAVRDARTGLIGTANARVTVPATAPANVTPSPETQK